MSLFASPKIYAFNKSLHIIRADHPYYVAVQYHPEYLSRPLNPSPPYLGLILAAANKLNSFISRGCNISPRLSYDYSSGDDDEDDEVTQALSASSQ